MTFSMKFITVMDFSIHVGTRELLDNQEGMKQLFSYCGYDIQIMDPLVREEYVRVLEIAKEKNIEEYEIIDIGDYLIVCI